MKYNTKSIFFSGVHILHFGISLFNRVNNFRKHICEHIVELKKEKILVRDIVLIIVNT